MVQYIQKKDLVINGTGKLNITTSDKIGILGKDDLIINDCILEVIAARNGIKGSDLVYVSGATITVQAETEFSQTY